MLCQNCKKNEADKLFIANWMGTQYQVHICDECLAKMWKYAETMGMKNVFQNFTGWWPGQAEVRKQGESPFPIRAGADIRIRVRLGALRARLKEAALREDYEEAARLRDSIARIEQEEQVHES